MLVFVYGTLKNRLQHFGGTPVEKVDHIEGYTLYHLGAFPAATPSAGKRIEGQVWELPDHMIKSLDNIEGTPYLYTREKAVTGLGFEVSFYVFARDLSDYPEIGETWR